MSCTSIITPKLEILQHRSRHYPGPPLLLDVYIYAHTEFISLILVRKGRKGRREIGFSI